MRKWSLVVLILTPVLVAGACGSSPSPNTGASGPFTLTVGISVARPDSDLFPLVAAESLGYFKQENLTVKVVPTEGSGTLLQQIAAGNVDVGTPSMFATATGVGQGLKLVDFYTMSYGNNFGDFGIFAPLNNGITSMSQLKGKDVGIPEPGAGEVAVLKASLGAVGLSVSDVNMVPIGEGDATTLSAIRAGKVAAYAAALTPPIFALEGAGIAMRDITPQLMDRVPLRGLITTPEALTQNREAFIRFGRAIAKATLYCETAPSVCEGFLRNAYPAAWQTSSTAVGRMRNSSTGAEQYEDALPAAAVPKGEQFGRHELSAMQALIDTLATTVKPFQTYTAQSFMVGDLLGQINDFDRQKVVAQAKSS